jgi:ubiquinone biosynthesis monooxygenase Coq7
MADAQPSLNRLPGDTADSVAGMVRVDQAGEYGATRIYAGQLAVMGDRTPVAREIARMLQQEQHHLDWFNAEIVKRGVRPTLLQPIWHVAGFALGAATALMGPRAAMACTVAVETEIDLHYQQQRDALGTREPVLAAAIAEFQAEEVEHRETARDLGAEATPGFPLLSAVIRAGCRVAIAAAKRV